MDTTVAVLYGVLWNDQRSSALCLSLQTVKEHGSQSPRSCPSVLFKDF